MAYLECNTKKIKSYGEDIVVLADDFNTVIEKLFLRLENINEANEEWVGEDADRYVSTVATEKELYENLYSELRKFGIAYQSVAEQLDDTIRKVKLD